MRSQNARDLFLRYESEPPSDVVMGLLKDAETLGGVRSLVHASIETTRPWTVHVAQLALGRIMWSDDVESAQLTALALDLAESVLRLNDWSAHAGCVDLLKVLVDRFGGAPIRHERDRQTILDLLLASLRSSHPNARAAPVGFLAALVDFGQPIRTLDVEGIRSLRLEAELQIKVMTVQDQIDDLVEFVALTREATASGAETE